MTGLLNGARVESLNEPPFVGRRPARRVTEAAVLEQVVAELREIDRRTGIERTLAIGELILNEFFGGDPANWRDRRRNKNNSIRRLAERDDCPFCRSALNEAVGVFVAVVGLPCVRTFGHISASHVASVLRLPLDEREPILQEAEKGRWSVRELRNKVTDLRRSHGERRGRPPVGGEMRSLSVLRNIARQLEEAISAFEAAAPPADDLRLDFRKLAGELGRSRARLIRLADGRPKGAASQPESIPRLRAR